MRVFHGMLALAAGAAFAMSAQADGLRGSLYQALIQDTPQQDVDMVSYQQFNSMEQRLAMMEARMASVATVGYAFQDEAVVANGCGDACGAACGCNDCWCNTCCGCTFSAELLFLRAQDSEVDASGDDYDTASRWTAGYMDNCGREWRVRYFEYATEVDGDDYLQMEYIDAEYAGRFTLGCNWRGELSGGVRWAQFDEEDELQYSDTIGPVLGALIYGPRVWNTDVFASVRNSWQYGSAFDEDFGTFSVTEVQLGAQYNYCLCGGNGFLRGVFEVQRWEGVYQDDSQDVGLFGFGLAAGITR